MGVLGRAISTGLLQVDYVNPRDFTEDRYQSVDDTPLGGGDGMIMKYRPLKLAVESLPHRGVVCYVSPQGKKWNYTQARNWAESKQERTLICGRYGGVDQRLINEIVDEEVSIGDYILTGGEPAVLVILDSLCRFVEGTLGNKQSVQKESFENQQLLECPQWTKPQNISGHVVPKILLSGHHAKIEQFRYLVSVLLTAVKRPDLLECSPAKKDLPKALKLANQLSDSELIACGLSKDSLQSI